ncbi:MAG: rhomboid family intramembrane serine protease [Sulfuritalea sp.]|nr:rhomboid family intramembrane serine protease [Sulfuritalea sp.]
MSEPRLSLHDLISQRPSQPWVTRVLIVANLLAFVALLFAGAGLWHSSSAVQFAWGASFGPATKDGEWWRLGSAMFLHFGVLHLGMNMWALWDGGRLVERMYGHARFAALYMVSGLTGNLLSLITQGDRAVSGGASGAVFGVFGALLVFLWGERRQLHRSEFRWMFWGATGFSLANIAFGFVVPGIDNAAHIGGFLTGILGGMAFARPLDAGRAVPIRDRLLPGGAWLLVTAYLATHIPAPVYRWSEEAQVRQEIRQFLREDAAITSAWRGILEEGKRGGTSFDELAGRLDTVVADHYEQSFEQLSKVHPSPGLPSAAALETLRNYAEVRRNASRALAEGLRAKDARQIREAMEQARRAGQPLQQGGSAGSAAGR